MYGVKNFELYRKFNFILVSKNKRIIMVTVKNGISLSEKKTEDIAKQAKVIGNNFLFKTVFILLVGFV